jgi:hypothetical protein
MIYILHSPVEIILIMIHGLGYTHQAVKFSFLHSTGLVRLEMKLRPTSLGLFKLGQGAVLREDQMCGGGGGGGKEY